MYTRPRMHENDLYAIYIYIQYVYYFIDGKPRSMTVVDGRIIFQRFRYIGGELLFLVYSNAIFFPTLCRLHWWRMGGWADRRFVRKNNVCARSLIFGSVRRCRRRDIRVIFHEIVKPHVISSPANAKRCSFSVGLDGGKKRVRLFYASYLVIRVF